MAAAGNAKAQVQMGLAYVSGDGVKRDDAEAAKWFRKAADQDDPLGERYLAEMYFKGRGVSADPAEAARYLRMAAEQNDAESQHNLAVLYLGGQGVPKNLKEAVKWMQQSAAQGFADGELGLGAIYENGSGVVPDDAEAAKWYRKAADQGNFDAMSDLAHLLATTRTPNLKNPQEAITLATKAAASGPNPDYLDSLAAAYFAAGQTQKAVDTEQKALAASPDNGDYKKALTKYLAANH